MKSKNVYKHKAYVLKSMIVTKNGLQNSGLSNTKVPYQLVVGDKEMEDATVNVRRYGSKETSVEDLSIFIDSMVAEVHNYSR